jgi:hypothetical protein
MPDGDVFLPQLENGYAAAPDQYNSADIVVGRIGSNISAGATGSGTIGSAAWIASILQNTTSYSFTGVISEVLVFDRKLSETERQEVYGYLSRKYSMDTKLPDTYAASHPSAYARGLTYWNIEHHPNTKGIPGLWQGLSFGNIKLEDFSLFPDSTYKSTGNVLSADTYNNVGL